MTFNWERYSLNYPELKLKTRLKAMQHFNRNKNCTDQFSFDNFEIFYINLEHRVDRKKNIVSELSSMGIKNYTRLNAIKEDFGALGASKSHSAVLTKFIESGRENCMILEDDFIFTQPFQKVNELLASFINSPFYKDFDILMLASNTKSEEYILDCPITKINYALTASGYIISKRFAPILLKNINESIELLSISKNVRLHAFDSYWIQLQHVSNWYCISPKVGKQMGGYSDIEKKITNFGV